MIAGHDRRSQCRPALGGAGIGDDLRPENRQYLKCAKEHADETFSLTQLDPAEHTSWPAMRVISLGIRTVPVLSVAKKLAAPRPTSTAPAAKCGLIRQDEAD